MCENSYQTIEKDFIYAKDRPHIRGGHACGGGIGNALRQNCAGGAFNGLTLVGGLPTALLAHLMIVR